eukprot:CAMPEP_0181241520 /NCGR_PEP_ID=MMETSP1096-20121128/41173_1 /TAXON_ID=156174 ORGANISM="Chrysochromulina ericina, Strain CCMP281" /NCGR_SAMPLE_ID=MMETSP1096 /ASSEMBLY_ACC=CAM_ASM_000453 /LENGTH=197 /DNA_ID=CAMNT_0023337613 /DNA_START=279 /DNA_END=873 /DNA_ORIENTATION=-
MHTRRAHGAAMLTASAVARGRQQTANAARAANEEIKRLLLREATAYCNMNVKNALSAQPEEKLRNDCAHDGGAARSLYCTSLLEGVVEKLHRLPSVPVSEISTSEISTSEISTSEISTSEISIPEISTSETRREAAAPSLNGIPPPAARLARKETLRRTAARIDVMHPLRYDSRGEEGRGACEQDVGEEAAVIRSIL